MAISSAQNEFLRVGSNDAPSAMMKHRRIELLSIATHTQPHRSAKCTTKMRRQEPRNKCAGRNRQKCADRNRDKSLQTGAARKVRSWDSRKKIADRNRQKNVQVGTARKVCSWDSRKKCAGRNREKVCSWEPRTNCADRNCEKMCR